MFSTFLFLRSTTLTLHIAVSTVQLARLAMTSNMEICLGPWATAVPYDATMRRMPTNSVGYSLLSSSMTPISHREKFFKMLRSAPCPSPIPVSSRLVEAGVEETNSGASHRFPASCLLILRSPKPLSLFPGCFTGCSIRLLTRSTST